MNSSDFTVGGGGGGVTQLPCSSLTMPPGTEAWMPSMFGQASVGGGVGVTQLPCSSLTMPPGTEAWMPSMFGQTSVGGTSGCGHSDTAGSGWPTSYASTYDRPCASAKYAPTNAPPGIALTLTLIGLSPVCRRSSAPGVPTYLQTKTFPFSAPLVVTTTDEPESPTSTLADVALTTASAAMTIRAAKTPRRRRRPFRMRCICSSPSLAPASGAKLVWHSLHLSGYGHSGGALPLERGVSYPSWV